MPEVTAQLLRRLSLLLAFVSATAFLLLLSVPGYLQAEEYKWLEHLANGNLAWQLDWNPLVHVEGREFYRPVSFFPMLSTYFYFGATPWLVRALFLLVHLANCILLFTVARLLGLPRLAAGLAAFLFLAASTSVLVLGYTFGAHDSIMTFFLLLLAIGALKSGQGWSWLLLVGVAALGALLSKEPAFLLVPVVSLSGAMVSPGSKSKRLAAVISAFLLSGLVLGLRWAPLSTLAAAHPQYRMQLGPEVTRTLLFALGEPWIFSRLDTWGLVHTAFDWFILLTSLSAAVFLAFRLRRVSGWALPLLTAGYLAPILVTMQNFRGYQMYFSGAIAALALAAAAVKALDRWTRAAVVLLSLLWAAHSLTAAWQIRDLGTFTAGFLKSWSFAVAPCVGKLAPLSVTPAYESLWDRKTLFLENFPVYFPEWRGLPLGGFHVQYFGAPAAPAAAVQLRVTGSGLLMAEKSLCGATASEIR